MKTINKISLLCRYRVFECETRAQKHDYFADNSIIMYWVFFFSFKDTEKGWLGFLIMITKCGNPLIWDAHLLKEVMKSNHFLVESIESQTNHFWSPPSSFRSFGVHMASPTAKRIFREYWGGATRQREG
jgi:hypothetical protein